ncbi:MAG: hypothetical protein SFU98_03955 [Leptospiraceae bacterium]|nr:hypothetical protein [Leptospiraceae bacterium]
MKTKTWIKVFIILFFTNYLFADRIILKSGKLIQGTVESQNNNIVSVKLANGKSIEVKKKEIASLLYVEPTKKTQKPRPKPRPIATENIKPSETPIAKESIKDDSAKVTPTTIQNTEKISEKITVDKELTNSVMKKFEDADKRREGTTKEEIQVLREELDYLKKEKNKTEKLNNTEDEFRKNMDKRLSGMEIRTRRLEKYLGMDESMVEYYQQPRSPWDIVKRSAVFPGWGHRYAREDYTGNTYSTLFIILPILGYFIDYQANVAKDAVENTLINKLGTQILQSQALGTNSTVTSLSNATIFSTISNYQTGLDAVNSQKQLANNFFTAAIVLYGFQLVHSYFTGVEWAKTKPRNYSNEELLRPTGFNWNIQPDFTPNSNAKAGTIYSFQYSTSF